MAQAIIRKLSGARSQATIMARPAKAQLRSWSILRHINLRPHEGAIEPVRGLLPSSRQSLDAFERRGSASLAEASGSVMTRNRIAETKPMSNLRPEVTRRKTMRRLAVEIGEIAKLAFPMVLTQVGQIAMMTTDLVLIGHISAKALAAAALAGRFYFICLTFGIGL